MVLILKDVVDGRKFVFSVQLNGLLSEASVTLSDAEAGAVTDALSLKTILANRLKTLLIRPPALDITSLATPFINQSFTI